MKNLFAVSWLVEQENVKMLQFILFCMINVTLPPLVSLIYHLYSFLLSSSTLDKKISFTAMYSFAFLSSSMQGEYHFKENLLLIVSLVLSHGFLGDSDYSYV